MIAILSAEPFQRDYYFANFETGEQIQEDKNRLSVELDSQFKKWYLEYQKYISLNLNELEPYWLIIDNLDTVGLILLKKAAKELHYNNIEKYFYFSMCRNTIFVVYPDGTSQKVNNFNI